MPVPDIARGVDTGAGSSSPSPAVRLAVAFIDANAQMPLTVTDIAAAAGVTPRALQYGFIRHLGVAPMIHLRRVRLARAHAELVASDSSTGASVAQIGRNWGFGKPSRFAAYYRDRYGQSPSATFATAASRADHPALGGARDRA